MNKKSNKCPLCRTPLKKIGNKKICPACGVRVIGDTFVMPPPGKSFGAKKAIR